MCGGGPGLPQLHGRRAEGVLGKGEAEVQSEDSGQEEVSEE